jgi:hypothetical protein
MVSKIMMKMIGLGDVCNHMKLVRLHKRCGEAFHDLSVCNALVLYLRQVCLQSLCRS